MLPLFYVDDLEEPLVIGDQEAHHALTVLRHKAGDRILVSDGRGTWVEGEISAVSKKDFTVLVHSRGNEKIPHPRITVIQALPKSDRVKECIELLVESGADEIIPWSAQRSISRWQSDSPSKWSEAIRTAGKQSRRFTLPKLGEIQSTSDLVRYFDSVDTYIFHEGASTPLSASTLQSSQNSGEINIIIGPEGGISEEELSLFVHAHRVRMGLPILRSAHAGIAAVSAIAALSNRWTADN
jgi:16S rRNA (uracil1498-N3)-methyltransferase